MIDNPVIAQIRHKGVANHSYMTSYGSVEDVFSRLQNLIGDIADITISSFSFNGHNIDIIIDYK